MSPSAGGRGLKLLPLTKRKEKLWSPSAGGRGLKHFCRKNLLTRNRVALRRRAWIETDLSGERKHLYAGRPPQEGVD